MLGVIGTLIGLCWLAALLLLARAALKRARRKDTRGELRLARLTGVLAVAGSLITLTVGRL